MCLSRPFTCGISCIQGQFLDLESLAHSSALCKATHSPFCNGCITTLTQQCLCSKTGCCFPADKCHAAALQARSSTSNCRRKGLGLESREFHLEIRKYYCRKPSPEHYTGFSFSSSTPQQHWDLTLSSCFFSSSACFCIVSFSDSRISFASTSAAANFLSSSIFSLLRDSVFSVNCARRKAFSRCSSCNRASQGEL